jgi:hypothetical protein
VLWRSLQSTFSRVEKGYLLYTRGYRALEESTLYTEVLHAVEESREKAFLAALLGGLLRCGGRQREKDPATLVKGPHIQVGDGEFFSLSVP